MLADLSVDELNFKESRALYRRAGKPEARDSLVAAIEERMDLFFSRGDMAFHWGKHHYRDASGDPGQRARWETGFAQRAAWVRVSNNGNQFADNALAAALAGQSAVKLLTTKPYERPGPSMMEMFAQTIPDSVRIPLAQSKALPRMQVAEVGGFLFSRGAILGMLVAGEPDVFAAMAWDPRELDEFWKLVDDELAKIDAAELTDSSLGFVRTSTGYPELFAGANVKDLGKAVRAEIPAADAYSHWSRDTAVGFGIGVRRSVFVRQCMLAEANPDREAWKRAHDAGLSIPSDPDTLSVEEQIQDVLENARALFAHYYPEALAKLNELVEAP